MSGITQLDPIEQSKALRKVSQIIAQVTVQFPIPQIVVPLADTLDWLLDDVSTEEQWLTERGSLQHKFAQYWHTVASQALGESPRQMSDQALRDADFRPLDGKQPWDVELTRVLRAALSELGPVGSEAPRVLPNVERMRAFARTMHSQDGKSILPVISFAPLVESEWRAILDKLNEIVELALIFEGAVIVWLIGGFYRDVEGRLDLRPQLSLRPPSLGTRFKPVRVLLSTAYEEQCPSLIPLVRVVHANESRPSDSLMAETLWHRVVIQLDIGTEEYELFTMSRLSEVERAMARKVVYRDEEARGPQIITGTVHEVPRPWQRSGLATAAAPSPSSLETTILPPRPALQAASQPPTRAAPIETSLAESLRRDAEELRRKGMAAVAQDAAIAQKYLLGSTVLENNSVDVWLTLVDLATSEKQKEAFRREAEKVLRRQHQNK